MKRRMKGSCCNPELSFQIGPDYTFQMPHVPCGKPWKLRGTVMEKCYNWHFQFEGQDIKLTLFKNYLQYKRIARYDTQTISGEARRSQMT